MDQSSTNLSGTALVSPAVMSTPDTVHAGSLMRRIAPVSARLAMAVLVALMPLSLALHGNIKIIAPALLFLGGVYLVVTRTTVREAYRYAWPVMACAVLTIVYAIANALGHGLGASAVDGAAHVLLYLMVAAVFAARLNTRIMWAGFSLTAIGFGVVCIVQHFVQGIDRAYSLNGGASTSIEFATLMLGLALLALVQLLYVRQRVIGWCLHGAAVFLGGYGGLLTQSRGPLLAFAIVALGLLVLKAVLSKRWRWCLGGAAMLVAAAAISMASLQGATLKRFSAVDQQIAVADQGQVDGSVSARLAMWRTATRALAQHPWAGLGINRFQHYLHAEIAAGRTSPALASYNNPHDMYLGAAAAGGVPGLLVLLAMFIVPLGFFVHHARASDRDVATAAWSGLAIVVLYALCALTDSVFYRVMTQSFYFLLVLGFAALIAQRKRAAAARRVGAKTAPPQ